MPNGSSGYYDEENGICWDEEYHDDEEYQSPFPDHCQNPDWIGGYDEDCVRKEKLYDAAERLWDYVFGESD